MLSSSHLLEKFPSVTLTVIGDLMLDRYLFTRVDRISPEAPVPVAKVEREHDVPGGACNVAMNIQSLGGKARICGVVGTDVHGDKLLSLLQHAGVDTRFVCRDPSAVTTVKTRILAERQQMLRVDREHTQLNSIVNHGAFLDLLSASLTEAQGAILEDYGKGVLTQTVGTRVLDECRTHGVLSGYDPKDNHELDLRGLTFATPNRKEAFHAAGFPDLTPHASPLDDRQLLAVAQALLDLWEPRHLMITLGPQGMLIQNHHQDAEHIPTRAREVFDVSGAGDTVIATTMLALAAGADFQTSAHLANCAAGIVVGKIGTATVTSKELLNALAVSAS